MLNAASIKSTKQIEKIRYSCSILADILKNLKTFIKPGMKLKEIDRYVETYIRDHGGKPAFKGHNGFPNSACTSVNDCVIHGIPTNRALKEGDIIGVDIGMNYQGGVGDTAYTYSIGEVPEVIKKLMTVAEESLYKAIEKAVVSNRIGDISYAVQEHVRPHKFGIVREFCGHGVGNALWEPPEIPNYGKPRKGLRLRKNMVIAIEPMLNLGTHGVYIAEDNWSVITNDHKPSAHYEHTVLITDGTAEILTKWKE